jgi:transposase
MIGDSQATKNADTADIETKGFCHYKCTNGIKRHLLVDIIGNAFFVSCTPANVSDDDGLVQLISENIEYFKSLPVKSDDYSLTIILDAGYHKDYLENKLIAIYPDILTKITIEVSEKMSQEEKKEKGLKGFVPISNRWVVECSNSWMDKCRVLWKNCESQLSTSIAKIKLCFIRLIVRRLCPAC